MRRPVESAQYLSIRYTERLAEAGIEPSVGSVGDSFDNALAETVIGLYKTELIRRRGPWKGTDDVEYGTLEWVDWFNHRRLLEPIDHVPPAEFEEAYYSARGETPAIETAGQDRISSDPGTTPVLNRALRASYGLVFGADGGSGASGDRSSPLLGPGAPQANGGEEVRDSGRSPATQATESP